MIGWLWNLLKRFSDVLGVIQFLQWLGLGAIAAALAGWAVRFYFSIGLPWNAVIGAGVGLIALAALPRLWHKVTVYVSNAPRFELVSWELICDPPLARSPLQETRDCTIHAVFVNRGKSGNAIALIRHIGIGRAGNEYPLRERRVVIPVTETGGFAQIECQLGAYPPFENRGYPQIEVEHTVGAGTDASRSAI